METCVLTYSMTTCYIVLSVSGPLLKVKFIYLFLFVCFCLKARRMNPFSKQHWSPMAPWIALYFTAKANYMKKYTLHICTFCEVCLEMKCLKIILSTNGYKFTIALFCFVVLVNNIIVFKLKKKLCVKESKLINVLCLNFRTCSLESSGVPKSLVFSIVPGTDAVAVLWKPQVRVRCCKVSYQYLGSSHVCIAVGSYTSQKKKQNCNFFWHPIC